jgi:glycosyltransferase involved in cell wall biosynthesis
MGVSDAGATGSQATTDSVTVGLVFEQHLGHRTFGQNLLAAARERFDIHPVWFPIDYQNRASPLDRIGPVGSLRGTWAGRRQSRRALSRDGVDVWIYNTQVPASLAGRRLRRPYIVITDVTPIQYDRMADGYGHKADKGGPFARWKDSVNRRVFREASLCVAWSSWVAESLSSDYGVDGDRIAVIPPGVDIDQWRARDSTPDDTPFRVLFVGSDFERKGGDLLLEAFRQLSPTAELHLVTKSNVASSDRVHVIDDLEPNDRRLSELFRCSDVFVLPSRAETFGIAAVEASASGLPVVASRIGGLTDIVIDEQTGLLIPPGDGDALARALVRLQRSPSERRRFGTAARHHAETAFDLERNSGRLFDLARAVAAELYGVDNRHG